MNQGNNWMPPMALPPLGFGMVMPQPVGTGSIPTTYGQVQPLPQAQASVGGQEYISGQWQYQQFNVGQQKVATTLYPQQCVANQQQWLFTQQKVAEDQKLMYDRMMKQRQFDEQKERLKEFSSRKKKGNVTADSMIQNIFDKQQHCSKSRSVKEHTSTRANHSSLECEGKLPTVGEGSGFEQGPPFAHSNHNQNFSSFHHQPCYASNQLLERSRDDERQISIKNTVTPINRSSLTSIGQSSMSVAQTPIANNLRVNHSTPSFSSSVAAPSSGVSDPVPITQRAPLNLPPWLADSSKIPDIYSKASSLVQADDEWVDTGRAYMLLMQTNVPPHFLGVLWEMVNRSEPGRLKIKEFHALLALVSCVQGGKSFIKPDILVSLESPVYPLIDHPILLPLVQKEIEKQQVPPPLGIVTEKTVTPPPTPPPPTGTSTLAPKPETHTDADDFDDFVSATVVPAKEQTFRSDAPHVLSSSAVRAPFTNSQSKQPVTDHQKVSFDTFKTNTNLRNLPTLGNSPLNHGKPKGDDDDEFDDFQSAPTPPPLAKEEPPASSDPSKQPELKREDKYAVFRDLFVDPRNQDSADDTFGDFCTSEPQQQQQQQQPLSNNLSQPPCKKLHSNENNNFIDSSKGCKIDTLRTVSAPISFNEWDSSDPFGEFSVNHCQPSLTEASSESSYYITANASADTSNDDDDFGDFVGPTDSTADRPNLIIINSTPNVSELKSETQSVASLELPGLELTVNLTSCETLTNSRTDNQLTSQKTDDWQASDKDLDQQFQSLRLEEKIQDKPIISKPQSCDDMRVFPSSLSLGDKYSIIREEQSKTDLIDPHIDLWKKCLEGCQKLLGEGVAIVTKLQQDTSLLEQVVATSQMKDYLTNLSEVWRVSKRIEASNRRGGPNPVIKDLSTTVHDLWSSLSHNLGKEIDKVECFHDSKFTPVEDRDSECCRLCLGGGDVSLLYGGQSYHPPCANLWLNVVDLTLPALFHARPTLL